MQKPILRRATPIALLVCLVGAWSAAAVSAQVVTKVAEDFESGGWIEAEYNTAAGAVSTAPTPAPDVPGSKRSLLIAPSFSGTFGGFGAAPAQPLIIPGDVKTIGLRWRVSVPSYGIKVSFADGYGRDQANGKAMEWDIRTSPDGSWQKSTFTVPADWVRPIRITKISTHNWHERQQVRRVELLIDQLEVQTDITNVDPATGILKTWRPEQNPADPAKALKQVPVTPLVQVALATDAPANVFTAEPTPAHLALRNWKSGELTGTARVRITDNDGKSLAVNEQPVRVESIANIQLPLPAPGNGLYHLAVELQLSDGTQRAQALTYARLPQPRALTEAQKLASPYGINYHAAGRQLFQPFRDAGIVWFREYAFQYDWLMRAKGDDGKYGGWPFYPRIIKAYQDVGAMVVPVLQRSVVAPAVQNGKVVGQVGPDLEWTRNIAHILLAFPGMRYWELSNEYDLPKENAAAERLVDWKNYQLYHEKFAQVCALLGGGELTAVENGRAGIWPNLVRDCVASGHFDQIGVVNSHHYCGVDAPETNHGNFNTGFEGSDAKPPALFFDDLRAVSRAGQSDGKPREHWLTEFGWDTLAGKVVSPRQQAVYLQRGWMLAMAAGVQKAFWFYHFDAQNPQQFFDGCGLLTYDAQPKLALAAMAGISWIMPTPRYLGSINVGDNTGGYIFEQDGQLIASLFTIEGEEGPTVAFNAKQLYDYLGNPIGGSSAKLSMAPVYAVGLDRHDPLFAQTAYDLDTPHMALAAAGDPVEPVLAIHNNRDADLACDIQVTLPEGWQLQVAPPATQVARGSSARVPFSFVVPPTEALGMKQVLLRIGESGRPVKQITLKVLVQPSVVLAVSPLVGRPGQTELSIKLGNQSKRPLGGTLALNLPDGWSSPTPRMPVDALNPGEVREIKAPLTWSAAIAAGQTATVGFDAGGGTAVARPIIPNQLQLHRAGAVTLDGDLADWSATRQLPAWMLGASLGEPNADVYLAWAPQGLYGALRVRDSKLRVSDPRSFWSGDVLEIFLDTADDKQQRAYKRGDHQFWLVPQPGENRVYVGRWKNAEEIPATLYDLPGIKSAARQTDDGYVVEFLLPTEMLENYAPAVGKRIGLNLNLTAHGERFSREVFWPQAKGPSVNTEPASWGSMELAE